MAGRFKELKGQRLGKSAALDDIAVQAPPPPWATGGSTGGPLLEEDLEAPVEALGGEPLETKVATPDSGLALAPVEQEPEKSLSEGAPLRPLEAVPSPKAVNPALVRQAEALKADWTSGWVTEQRRRGEYEKKLQSNEVHD